DRMLSAVGEGVCATCHSDDEATAKIHHMQSSILTLRLHIDTTAEVLGRAERFGMEVSKPKFDLEQANAELVKARVSVHAFSPEKIAELTTPAMKTITTARKAADYALEEVGFRLRGQGYALTGIAATMIRL